MQEVTFELEALTPLFLGTAEQTGAELRSPAFRGLMRYWLRALGGGIVGTDTEGFAQVMKFETTVFGSTSTGSAVSVQVTSVAPLEAKKFTERTSEKIGGQWQATGKGYLLWSMAQSGSDERGNLKPARWYFPPLTRFHITLATRDQDTTPLKQAISSLWLLTSLGGIGSRSRRCAGSLKANVLDKEVFDQLTKGDLPFDAAKTIQELKNQIEKGIQTVRMFCNLSSQRVREAQFDILHSHVCRIWILSNKDKKPWINVENALEMIGKELQQFRSNLSSLEERATFGLPLIARGLQDQRLKKVLEKNRRASPLLLKLSKLHGEQYVGIVVLFKTHVQPVIGLSDPDYSLIEGWIEEKLIYTTATEVNL